MAKSTNYLASALERQRQFKIPEQQKIHELISLTKKIKQAWKPLLPDEILDTLMVIGSDNSILTLTTTSHTIANHLNYTYQPLLALLHQTYPYLQSIYQIKFSVINLNKIKPPMLSNKTKANPVETNTDKRQASVTNVTSRKLSPITRQNITQLTQDVTLNPRLAQALLQLANND